MRQAADQSLVLLKNEGNTLPLPHRNGMKLAVIGRNAQATRNMQGNYFGKAPFLVSPLEGLGAYATTVSADGTDVDAAISLIHGKDAVVLVVGLESEGGHHADEAEGLDRTTLLMPYDQNTLVARVAAAAATNHVPVVLLVMGGGPVDLSDAKANNHIGAIMWVGYPGQSGGAAIADAVFGATNPSAKLTMTWYPQSFATNVNISDMGMRPNSTTGNPGRSHRTVDGCCPTDATR